MRKENQNAIKLPRYIKIELSVCIILFVLYVIAIFMPVVFLHFRIVNIGDINSPNCYGIENTPLPDGSLETSKAFYQGLNASDSKLYTMFTYLSNEDADTGIRHTQSYATEPFFNLHDFNLDKGRMFEPNDFLHQADEVIPIVVGYDVQELYKFGETYEIKQFGAPRMIKVKVVGVLDDNSTYISHWLEKVKVDNFCIIPISEYFAENYFTYRDFDMYTSRTVIETDNPEDITELINDIGLKISIFPMNASSTQIMNRFLSAFVNRLIIGSGLFLIAMVFILVQKELFNRKIIQQKNL